MGFFAKWRIHKQAREQGRVEVSEKDGVRTLHLGGDTVQSAMLVSAPFDLKLAYTRSMLACLLFHKNPRDFLMVGLGGGSVPKWVYRNLPESHTTVVELNPEVVSVARGFFFVPPDDERFQLVVGDGVDHVAAHPGSCDVLMVDGYDEVCHVESLATPEFYASCRAALRPGGVMVVNLWSSEKRFNAYVQRMFDAFEGLVLTLPAEERSNIIALAFERSPNMPKWDDLRDRARELERRYGMEFLRFVDGLRKLNLHNERRLLI
jgi:spermidine synthase